MRRTIHRPRLSWKTAMPELKAKTNAAAARTRSAACLVPRRQPTRRTGQRQPGAQNQAGHGIAPPEDDED